MASETEKAQAAAHDGTYKSDNIFAKILRKEIPCTFIYEDEQCVAFNDVAPQAPTHILVIPKKSIARMEDCQEGDQELLGHLLMVAKKIAADKNLKDGYRLTINNGVDGGQSVFHLHVHLMAGRQMGWPPG